jgi:DNA (cytosine-5)-methyltransferase 1
LPEREDALRTVLSSLAFVGGFDLAAEWMGWENLFHCEWNSYCRRVLKHHFPKAIGYGDITSSDFTIWRGRVDVLSGGFPCQPFSNIGEQRGDADERYLWPEYRRAYNECGAVWVVPENVYGLISWDGGRIFEQVCKDLETDGYDVQPYIIPASGVGAGHQRKRVFVVAYSAERRLERRKFSAEEGHGEVAGRSVSALVEDCNWTERATSYIPGGVYGLSDRVDRTAALGNAVVPQVAYQIFQAIKLASHDKIDCL